MEMIQGRWKITRWGKQGNEAQALGRGFSNDDPVFYGRQSRVENGVLNRINEVLRRHLHQDRETRIRSNLGMRVIGGRSCDLTCIVKGRI